MLIGTQYERAHSNDDGSMELCIQRTRLRLAQARLPRFLASMTSQQQLSCPTKKDTSTKTILKKRKDPAKRNTLMSGSHESVHKTHSFLKESNSGRMDFTAQGRTLGLRRRFESGQVITRFMPTEPSHHRHVSGGLCVGQVIGMHLNNIYRSFCLERPKEQRARYRVFL